jgi:GH15 family glucan-1,4-alpha-glucosidase
MVEFIFKMVETYNLYGQAQTVRFETTLNIEHYYPIQEDEDAQKGVDMQEVITEVRSRYSYMKKWGDYEHVDKEIEQIQLEKQLLQDSFTQSLVQDLGDD